MCDKESRVSNIAYTKKKKTREKFTVLWTVTKSYCFAST